jgi:hypothetical protein
MASPARFWYPLAIAAAAVAAFGAGLQAELLADDHYLVPVRLAMPVETFLTADYWHGYMVSGLYRPLGLLWLWWQHAFWGEAPGGYHAISLGLHVMASVLVYLVLRPRGERIALGAALLFAVHPVHAEAVIPVYGQLDLLAAVLVLAAILGVRAGYTVPALAALGAAMLVKESALVGLALLWLIENPGWRVLGGAAGVTAGAVSLRVAVLGGLALPGEATVIGPGASVTLWAKSVIISIGHAVRLCVWPTGQTVYYGHLRDSLIDFPSSELGWLAGGVLVAIGLWMTLPRREWLTAFGWLAICLLPIANLVPIGVLVAERALYLAVAGVVILAPRLPVAAVAALAVVSLGASWQVTNRWQSERALWESTVADHPSSPKAQALLGWALLRDQEVEKAGAAFDRALALNPRSSDGRVGRVVVLWHQAGCAAARGELEEARRLFPADKRLESARAACGVE